MIRPPRNNVEATSRRPGLFALIIGIDEYKHKRIAKLNGAIKDANAVERFLRQKLNVPKARIVNLRNEAATRQKMLEALKSLGRYDTIKKTDPILIYYAGHGSEVKAPEDWNTQSGKIQMILPYDFKSEDSRDSAGQGIFDIEIAQILRGISQEKSDNITVLFDCCYSGSGTRTNSNDETFAIRGIDLPSGFRIPEAVDRLRRSGLIRTGPSSSHVLLAACKQDQSACERNGEGAFTTAVLNLLSKEGVHKLTYKDVIMSIPELPNHQHPQCEGLNQNRFLFKTKVRDTRLITACIRWDKQPNGSTKYILDKGEAHGVTKGAEFTVYRDKHQSTAVLSVVVDVAGSHESRCTLLSAAAPPHVFRPLAAYAVQTRIGERPDLRIFIDDKLSVLLRCLEKESERFFHFVKEGDYPDLILKRQGDLVQFSSMNRLYGLNGLKPILHMNTGDVIRASDSDHLISILRDAANFYWHLHRSNDDDVLMKKIELRCHEVTRSDHVTDELLSVYLKAEEDQTVANFTPIKVYGGRSYGYTVKNKSKAPLYTLTKVVVEPYHVPGSATNGKVSYCLAAEEELPIGFGDSALDPRCYSRESHPTIGILKLYVSTTYIDYGSLIVQETPFPKRRRDEPVNRTRSIWGALTAPIVIKGAPGF
ncbi:hypothetical protein DXG01_014759 [Tephrocybe rancida]|nr:hypothetical protein DXG01_014759 [Tephrocybe rancida]